MKKRLNFLETAAVVLLALIVLASFWGNGPKDYRRNVTIVAFGDSLTRGYGVPPGKNFVTFLSEYTSIPIINSGFTGYLTSHALIRLKSDVLDYDPDIVLVLLGGNDFLSGFSEEVVRANLQAIIRTVKRSGAKVILVGVSKQVVPSFESMFERLAIEEKVAGYVPNILGGIVFRKDLLFDTIHPNQRGHEIIAQRILPVLEEVLRESF
jgi:acyl-CoA thioesterase I